MKKFMSLIAMFGVLCLSAERSDLLAADDPEVQTDAPPPESVTSTSAPVYKPPIRGAPTRRVGAATRGAGDKAGLYLAVLAPEATGFTSEASPALFWFLSHPSARDVDFTLVREDRIEPVAELRLTAPSTRGIWKVSLSEFGVALEPGVTYEWHIALIMDRELRSTDIVTSGTLRHEVLDDNLQSQIQTVPAEEQFAVFAEAGYWYDAIDLASTGIASGSVPQRWSTYRAALLRQVGLQQVADFD